MNDTLSLVEVVADCSMVYNYRACSRSLTTTLALQCKLNIILKVYTMLSVFKRKLDNDHLQFVMITYISHRLQVKSAK